EMDLTLTWTDDVGMQRQLSLMRPKKTFVAPPPKENPKLPSPEPVLDAPPEIGSAAQGSGMGTGLPGLSTHSKPPPRRFTPPYGASRASGSGPAGGGAGGDGLVLDAPAALSTGSKVSAAIIGLNPSDSLKGPIPPGSRSGEFSAAPSVGKASTGDVKGG